MDTSRNDESQGALKFTDIEKKVDSFIQSYNFNLYKVHEALYCFEEDALSEVITLLHHCKLPKKYNSYKDVLREKLSIKLNLTANDLLIFAEEMIYAKLFFQLENQENQADRRACGLSPELLEHYKGEFFSQNTHKEDIIELLPFVVEDVLTFRKLTPLEFKKTFIVTLVNLVEIIVIAHTSLDNLRHIRGLSYYLLREMFDELMLFIAEDILFSFSNADKKAIEFLSHFSLNETIDTQGNRYKANPILDESNYAWNMTTIRSTLLQHKRAKQAFYDKKNALITIKKKLESHKIAQKELNKHINIEQQEFLDIETKIKSIHKTLQKLQEVTTDEVTFSENGEDKIFPRNVLIAKLFKKEDSYLIEKNKLKKSLEEMVLRIANKQKDIDIWEKKYDEGKALLEAIEANGHPIDKQYERIQRALAKTLASR
ncbi:MAG: hypothetical protein PHN18_04610 [Sulfurospirillaceae bacterium]|nr:hypothetical protein [Sulfurospirillaceae bacterium]MDD2825312.1 hypothetical protein [Sulfurospirillaceae bacterium]